MRTFLRRLRGAVGNALLWGVGWFGIGLVVHTIIRVLSGGRFFWPYEFYNALYMAASLGISGAAIGAGFSVFIAANFKNQRVEGLSPWRFAFGGGLVTALVSLGLLLARGWWIWPTDLPVLVAYMGIYSAVGGTIAFGTITLAQRGGETGLLESSVEALPPRSGSKKEQPNTRLELSR